MAAPDDTRPAAGLAGPDASVSALVPAPPEKASARRRVARLSAAIPETADVILVGDSLVASWPEAALADMFPGRIVLNLGLPGERIRNTLWRLGTGETAHLRPDWCVLLLGTNDLGDGVAPDAIAAGLNAVLADIAALWRRPRTVVVGLPWREPRAADREAARRCLNDDLLPRLARAHGARFLDVESDLGPEAGAIALLPDRLHLSVTGYTRLSRALARLVRPEPHPSRR